MAAEFLAYAISAEGAGRARRSDRRSFSILPTVGRPELIAAASKKIGDLIASYQQSTFMHSIMR